MPPPTPAAPIATATYDLVLIVDEEGALRSAPADQPVMRLARSYLGRDVIRLAGVAVVARVIDGEHGESYADLSPPS
ncbi:hypothetical protein [Tsukamurella soli]|uniref:hypothetical protein n=1 Tax=Tsukamurella soli TaxID=644556 RepID=UPI0036177FC4